MYEIVNKEILKTNNNNNVTSSLVKVTEKHFIEQSDVYDKLDLNIYLGGPVKKLTLLTLPKESNCNSVPVAKNHD